MLYYTNEVQMDEGRKQTAGIKARDDIVEIFRQNSDAEEIEVVFDERQRKVGGPIQHLASHIQAAKMWNSRLDKLKENDYIFIQYPLVNHSVFFSSVLEKLKKRGVRIIVLIHDLELFRLDHSASSKFRVRVEETSVLKQSDYIIVHNERMRNILAKHGFDRGKIYSLKIFDYLIPNYGKKHRPSETESGVIIAGSLKPYKAGYAYQLPDDVPFHLYGVGYSDTAPHPNVTYYGSFDPDELPFVMKGAFGLVWDGESADTCSGAFGQYLKINNPHKTSLYLASDIPVVIWEKAALAGFIKKNRCGITVKSLEDLHGALHSISEAEYTEMKKDAARVGRRLRNGYYTKRVVRSILKADAAEKGQ